MQKRSIFYIFALSVLFFNNAYAFDVPTMEDVNEIMLEEDPYLGLSVELEKFPTMVYMSNLTKEVYPSKYVQNIDRLITSLAQSKNADAKLFKNNKKIIKYLDSREKFTVYQVLKTAVYKGNIPDEYTTYILKNKKGDLYAIPEAELKEVTKSQLSTYERKLLNIVKQKGKNVRIVFYFEKPDIYYDKKPPFEKEELDSVFNFFLGSLKGYYIDNIQKSKRNFRLSANINIDTLSYIISDYESLHIEDMELLDY